jgi:cobalamin biosynthesis protein CobT
VGGYWVLAAPGGAWNATDVVSDPRLRGRRLHVAACDATTCVLHYERGGIAHIQLVMTLAQKNGQWKATWIAYGQPAIANLAELRSLLTNQSKASYSDGAQAAIEY